MIHQNKVVTQEETAVINGDDVFRTFIDDADFESKQSSRYVLPEDLKNALDEVPDVRVTRVEALKKQVSDGTYDITDEKLAVVAQGLSEDFRLISDWPE